MNTVGTALAATAVAVTVAVSSPVAAGAQVPGGMGSTGTGSTGVGSTGTGSTGVGSLGPGSAEALSEVVPAPGRLVATGGSPTGACAGAVATTLSGNGYPASASVSWAFAVVGIGPCDLTATLSWRNLRTGQTGEKLARIPQPRISLGVPDPISHPYEAIIPTGSGPVEYRLTTTGGAVAGPIVVDTAGW